MKISRGFTIIELLVVIAIVAILATLAIPSYLDFFEKSRLRGATEAVYEQLQYARAQALKRSTSIIVDFSADGTTTWSLGMTDDSECWALADPSTCTTWGCNADPSVDPSTDPDAACIVEYDNDRTADSDGDGNLTDPVLKLLASTDFSNVTMSAPEFDSTSELGVCDTTVTDPTIPASALPVTRTCIEPIRGLSRKTKTTAPTGHIQLENGDYKLQVRVNEVGGVTICRPQNEKYFVGYDECPD